MLTRSEAGEGDMPGRTSATLWLTESAQLPAPRRASKTSGPTSFPDMLAEKSDTRPDTGDQRLLSDSGLDVPVFTNNQRKSNGAKNLSADWMYGNEL